MKNLYRKALLTIILTAVVLSGCADPNFIPRVNWTASPPDVAQRSAYLDRQLWDLQRRENDQRMAREAEGRTLAREDFNSGLSMGARAPFNYEGRCAYFQEWECQRNQYQCRFEDNARKAGEADYLCSRYDR